MKKTTAQILSVLLVLLLTAVLFSCGTDDITSDGNSRAQTASSSTDETSGRANAKDSLPERDFGGRAYTIMCRSELEYEFSAEEQNNEYINDIIYERNAAVEARFKVKIETMSELGQWGHHDSFMSSLRTQINGGTAAYDIIAGYAAIIPSIVGEDLLYNWYEIDYIDFTREWWSEDITNELTINGKMYLLAGDVALTLWQSMQGIFFNKTAAQDNDLGDLYKLVTDGEWTFDKMAEYAKTASRNTGDVAWTDEDFHGYVTARTVQVDIYLDAFNIPVTTKNSDGLPEYTVNCERTYSALSKLYNFICTPGNGAYYGSFDSASDATKVFALGNALFLPNALEAGEILRDYDITYGILPNPKFDENQASYYTTCQDYFSLMAVPATATDTDFVGIITEALCSESYRSVVDDYYDVILKSRYTYDDESPRMIDIIREGLKFNFGYLYSYALDWPAHQLNICINNNSNDFVSLWQSKESMFNANLAEALKAYE